jgi:response regulator RpfG family c-di-GMP phosphodiesterase
MNDIFLEAITQISVSKSFDDIFGNLKAVFGKLGICKSVEFAVCRSKGELSYPHVNKIIEHDSLAHLRDIEEDVVSRLSAKCEFLSVFSSDLKGDNLFFCRLKVLEQGEEAFAFFTKGDAFDEAQFLYLLTIAHAPLNFVSSQNTLGLILEYAAFVADQKEPEMMLVALADMAREFSAADRTTIWLGDKKEETLWTKVAHGMPPITIPASTGIAGFSYQKGEVVICNDPYSDNRFNPEIDKKTGYQTKSIVAIPIKNSENEIMGSLQSINKLSADDKFNELDVSKLKLVSSYIGNTIELANLHKEIEDTQKEVIFTMGEVGEFRSKETGNHVKRVAEYSYQLALGCGLSKADAELLRMASPMHDIGKVAIDDSILKKPGKLTDEEFEIMKSHTTMGYEVLRHSKRRIIAAAATVAYEHHEKYNGRGYPRGLKGEEIHIFGRITALADVFDALGSDRCYKKAWELESIYELFRRESGEHFDNKIVDAFFVNIDEILKIRGMFRDV